MGQGVRLTLEVRLGGDLQVWRCLAPDGSSRGTGTVGGTKVGSYSKRKACVREKKLNFPMLTLHLERTNITRLSNN